MQYEEVDPESMLMMVEDQAGAADDDNLPERDKPQADAADDADLPERDVHFQEPTQQHLFRDILCKHLFEHMQDTLEVGAWYSGPPISQRLTSHSTHLGLRLNTQLADVDGDVVPVEAVGAIAPRAVAPLDDVPQPDPIQALARLSMVQFEPNIFQQPQPDPLAEGSHFFFQVINRRPSRGKFVQLLSGVGAHAVGDTVLALHGATMDDPAVDEDSITIVCFFANMT